VSPQSRLQTWRLKAQLIWDLFDPSPLGRYRRMARPVDGWLSRAEEAILFRLARSVPSDQAIVELGSWLGRSTVLLGGASRTGNGAAIFAVDFFRAADEHRAFLESRVGVVARDYLDAFQENMRRAGVADRITPIRSDTAAAGERWAGPPVGLLFLDGDHTYPAVCRDWVSWRGHLAPRARIAFHDYANPSYDVTRFVDEQVAAGRLRALEQHDSILVAEVPT
jgi:predicted O-methyltransferase YrrM